MDSNRYSTCLLGFVFMASCSGGYAGSFYGNIDPNNEDYLRVLTREQSYYDSATHQVNILQGNSTNSPGPYLTQVIAKDFANQRLLLHADGFNFTETGPECFAQSKIDFAAIEAAISHENDTIPESAVDGGQMLVGEPYFHQTLQANGANFNPLVRLGEANANAVNPGKYLNIWIVIAAALNTYGNYLAGNDDSLATTMNKMLGNCFKSFLITPSESKKI